MALIDWKRRSEVIRRGDVAELVRWTCYLVRYAAGLVERGKRCGIGNRYAICIYSIDKAQW